MPEQEKVIQTPYEEVVAERNALRDAFDFLFPMPWGNLQFTLHPADALADKWSVWDKYGKRTFSVGNTALDAVLNARRRWNSALCQEYKTPNA